MNEYWIGDPKEVEKLYNDKKHWKKVNIFIGLATNNSRIVFSTDGTVDKIKHSVIKTTGDKCISKLGHGCVVTAPIEDMTNFYGANYGMHFIRVK